MNTRPLVIATIIFSGSLFNVTTFFIAYLMIFVYVIESEFVILSIAILLIPVMIGLFVIPPVKYIIRLEKRAFEEIHRKYGGEFTSSFAKLRLKFDDFELRVSWADLYIEYYRPNVPDISIWRNWRKNWAVSAGGLNDEVKKEYIGYIRSELLEFYYEGFVVQEADTYNNGNVVLRMRYFEIDADRIMEFAVRMSVVLEKNGKV